MFALLLLSIVGMALGFGRKAKQGCARTFPKVLRLADFAGGDVDVACTSGVKTRIGHIVVPEQTSYIWGRGSAAPGASFYLMGSLEGDLNAAGPTDLAGTLIVEAMNANDRNPIPLGEYDLAQIRLGASDPQLRVRVPLTNPVLIGPNSRIVFYLRLTSTATFDYGLSTLNMDCVTSCE